MANRLTYKLSGGLSTAQLKAVKRQILIHAILETALGVANVEAIAAASPRMHGMSLGPADLAASRGMKSPAAQAN